MKAADVMSTKVVAVGPDTPGRSVAHLLFKNGISAVPVIDDHGAPLGMVSEGDLMPRNESEREARRDWWLQVLAEGEDLNPEFVKYLKSKDRPAREIMISPVVTVDENTDLVEVAELLSEKKIKRVPVVRDGHMVGIVSRADLVKAYAQPLKAREPEPSLDRSTELKVPSERLEALTRRKLAPVPAPPSTSETDLSAVAFRSCAVNFEEHEKAKREEERRLQEEKHHQQALAAHLTDEKWRTMLRTARAAAQKGDYEHLILRFPSELCSDHGRAVNAPDPDWPAMLRGMAAEVFMRWKNELRPQGFSLQARVVDFPDGVPGDIGLYLSWGK